MEILNEFLDYNRKNRAKFIVVYVGVYYFV